MKIKKTNTMEFKRELEKAIAEDLKRLAEVTGYSESECRTIWKHYSNEALATWITVPENDHRITSVFEDYLIHNGLIYVRIQL